MVEYIDASSWNTYKRKIIDLYRGNRGRDFKVMSDLLDNDESILRDAMDTAGHSH